GVEAAVRVRGDHLRVDLGESPPAVREEVAVGHLDRGLVGTVPVGAQHQLAPVVGVRGDPDMGDHAGGVDVRQGEGLPRLHVDAGRDLPALAEVAGGLRPGALGGAAPAPDGAVEVLGADGAGLHAAEAGERGGAGDIQDETTL